jgi:hypothetical protein
MPARTNFASTHGHEKTCSSPTCIRTERFGNIANLVNSSTELYYKPGTLRFGSSGGPIAVSAKPT